MTKEYRTKAVQESDKSVIVRQLVNVIDSKNEEIKALKQCLILMSKHLEKTGTQLKLPWKLGPKNEWQILEEEKAW